jgi:phage terminase large subunit GpA-like protein
MIAMPRRRSKVAIKDAHKALYSALATACAPRPIVTVSAWADEHRILSAKGSSEPGKWHTDRVPFAREIMDCLSAHHPAQRIVLRFAAQLTKTEIALSWLGYIVDHAPAPTLVVVPTLEVRKRWVKQRLDPLLLETPALRSIFDARRRREAGNSEDIKDFPGGILVLGGANSPASLSSMPIRYVICDEVDRFPWQAGAEGDPLTLIDERTKTFPRRKVLLLSTPTVADASRIEIEYQNSDQRTFQVPCPRCGIYHVLDLFAPDGTLTLHRMESTGTVLYACPHCHEYIPEHRKTMMLAQGQWVAKYPERPVRGYTLSGMYSPIGLGFTWSEILEKYEDAQSNSDKMKVFFNTTLGRVWVEEGDSVEPLALLTRLEHFPDTLPIFARTCGVDVQKDRLEMTVVDWGAGEECWVHDHLIIPGDTALPGVWDELAQTITDLRPQAVAIDTGYNTQYVYDFVEKRKFCYPVKGISGAGRPVVEDEKQRRQRLRQRHQRRQVLYLVGVDTAKAVIYSRLKLEQVGRGYVHFPRTPSFDAEYFSQLAAEKLVIKIRNNRQHPEWVQTRARNEALDAFVYALAALRLHGSLEHQSTAPVQYQPTPVFSPSAAPAVLPLTRQPPPRIPAPSGFSKPGW